MAHHRPRNRSLVRFILLPTIFLTVALLGGLRINADTHAFVFIAPPLLTLLLALMLMILFVRGHLIELHRWMTSDQPALTNISHALTLLSLFFASAQAFNSVLPESGLLHWLFSFFFLWTLWNNQFADFDARKLLRSLAVLFGTAFVLKHILIASLYAPEGGWLRRLAGTLIEGVSLGTLDAEIFAPATGYISFFTLALYVAGLTLLTPAPEELAHDEPRELVRAEHELSPLERQPVRTAIQEEHTDSITGTPRVPEQLTTSKNDTDELSEETLISRKPRT